MNLENIKNKTAQMILQFSVPSIMAMVLNSLITIVDGFFIGNYIGRDGIAAVNLGLPILYIYLGVGIMIGVGGVAIAGMSLGAQQTEKSIAVFNQTTVTTVVASVLLSVVVFVCFHGIMSMLNMNPQVAACFEGYYSIMIFAYPVMMLSASLGMFMRCEGKPGLFMLVNLLTVIINIILDYVFIAKLHYGIEGTAIASLISVMIGALCMAGYFWKKSIIFKFKRFTFSKEVLKNTVFNGIAELIGQLSMSISMFAYNWAVLRTAGVTGVAAFTIVGYVAYLFNMVLVGFGQGASPLISFSFGAEEFGLSQRIRKLTNTFVFVSGLIAMLCLSLSVDWYSSVFVQNEGVRELARSGLVIYMISFLFSGINTITTFYFTSIGRAREAALISMSRGLVVLLLCIILLPMLWGMNGVWLVAPVTEAFTLIISLTFIARGTAMGTAMGTVNNSND